MRTLPLSDNRNELIHFKPIDASEGNPSDKDALILHYRRIVVPAIIMPFVQEERSLLMHWLRLVVHSMGSGECEKPLEQV